MAIEAGRYEPVLAVVYRPTRSKTSAKEPNAQLEPPTILCQRHIRFKTYSGQEQFNQGKSISITGLTIWMHKDEKTQLINTGMWIIHRGIKYGIVAKVILEIIQDEVGFKVCTDS